jgi:asparagine synthase (glutamine-hydrolysing)
MCGIAGAIDLTGSREPDNLVVRHMASALRHRGPDDDGFMFAPGFGMGNRRLAIVGVTNGRQPIYNETGTVGVIGNGEFFDYPELRHVSRLKAMCSARAPTPRSSSISMRSTARICFII